MSQPSAPGTAPSPASITMFDPSGQLRDVPAAAAADALRSGGERAILFDAPDGQQRWVRLSQAQQARAAGGTVAGAQPNPALVGDISKPSQRERFLNTDLYPVGAKGEGVGENLHNIAQRAGVGVFQLANAAAHPRQTVASLLASLLPEPAVRGVNRVVDLENKMVPGAHYLTTHLPEGTTNPLQQAYEALVTSRGPMETAGKIAPLVGQSIAGEAAGVAVPEIASGVGSGAESVVRGITDTGKGPIEKLVKQRQGENDEIAAVNQDRLARQQRDQAKADADHRANLLKLKQEYEQGVRNATEKARTGTAEDRAQYQAKQLAAKQKYEQAVRDAQQQYESKKVEAEQANAAALRDYNRKLGETVQGNRAVAQTEQARRAAAAHTQVAGSQLIYRLNQLDRQLRDRAGQMYDAIREKVGNASTPGSSLAQATREALGKISGTSETPKIFRDILSKYPEAEPETITYQGAQIPRGTPLYDVLAQHGAAPVPPVSFADLQGYYTELGRELSKGTLPDDVYRATRALQDSVGDMMQQMADKADPKVGKQLTAARKFYRQYMDTFHEPAGPSASGSPIAQALLAKDPEVAVQKFAGASGDRGIAVLRRYDPELADLAQRARTTKLGTPKGPRTARQSLSSVKQPTTKPVPGGPALPLPPVLESAPAARAANLPLPPVLPEPEVVPVELKPTRTISAGDIVAARKAAAEASAGRWWTRGRWAAAAPIIWAMRGFFGGHIPFIPLVGIESAGIMAATKAATSLLRYPPMIDFLSKARPEDVALIPPELWGDLPGLVSQAQRQGIKVAPALVAAAAGTKQTADQTPAFTPQQAIQAMTPAPAAAGGAQ